MKKTFFLLILILSGYLSQAQAQAPAPKKINLTLDEPQAILILKALGQLKFDEVAGTYLLINSQIVNQQKAISAPPTDTTKKADEGKLNKKLEKK